MGSFDGAEWRTLLMLEDQLAGEFSYPAIILRGNDRIDITYTYNREKIKHVSLRVR
jgi:predicted neuraminidase